MRWHRERDSVRSYGRVREGQSQVVDVAVASMVDVAVVVVILVATTATVVLVSE